mgnify:CR=1 FL=1
MIYISISQNETSIILDCHKKTKDGAYFRLVIERMTRRVIERPDNLDADVSAAYAHVYRLLKNNEPLPAETVAAWG